MCPFCATTAVFTALTATASSTVIATWGGELGQLIAARLRAAKERFLGKQARSIPTGVPHEPR
jgi:hypothetical protein